MSYGDTNTIDSFLMMKMPRQRMTTVTVNVKKSLFVKLMASTRRAISAIATFAPVDRAARAIVAQR